MKKSSSLSLVPGIPLLCFSRYLTLRRNYGNPRRSDKSAARWHEVPSWAAGATRLLLAFILLFPSCTRLSYDILPHKTAIYHSLGLKVNVKNNDSGQRENFKILLKYDDSRDKMFFLSPLNQVFGLLLLESEQALLIATKKKKFWKGTFNDLVQEIWGLDFDYREFKRLVVDGVLPGDQINEPGLNISFEEGLPGEAPRRLKIEKDALLIKIKISDRKSGKGIISFSRGLKGMKEAGIRELLEVEE